MSSPRLGEVGASRGSDTRPNVNSPRRAWPRQGFRVLGVSCYAAPITGGRQLSHRLVLEGELAVIRPESGRCST
jgi:hypothetical protein